MDKISIIVPIYNIQEFLEKCVKSIQKQTYNNLEIILVDDGSTDNCKNMCDEFALKDERIKVIHKKNGGLSSARNEGIKKATGNYVCFVDGDDYIREDYCEVLYNALIKTKSDVSAVAYKEIKNVKTRIYNSASRSKKEFDDSCTIYNEDEIIIQFLHWKNFRIAWNKLYKAEIIKNQYFKEGATFEDMFFNYKVLSNCNRVAYVNSPCYCYIRRDGSISTTYSEKNLNDFADAIIDVFTNVKEKFPQLNKHNYFALLQWFISLSLKYMSSNQKYPKVIKKSNIIVNELNEYIETNDLEFLLMLNKFEKACLYSINYNKEMFYSILKKYQKMQEEELEKKKIE